MAGTTVKKVDPTLVPLEPGLELWRNMVPGIVAINRSAEYGRKRVELIQGGRAFNITPQERRMNQNACARPELDVFTNGTLQPVTLLEDEPDTVALRQNPNVLDDKDIERVFRLKGEAFAERLAQVSNSATLSRLSDLAREPRLNATIQQYEQIKARQRVVDSEVVDMGPSAPPAAERKPRAVTPK